jgi:endoglucanase
MKKIMKGALAWFSIIMLALCMFTSITGCEKKADTKENSSSSESENSGATKTEKKEMDLLSMTSVELAREMGNGFNLGNTMEAYGHKEGIDKETSFYETLWGNPVTTQELFDHYKECGFNSVRIPVAWTNKMDFENDDFTISEDYLARVKEIVDYAYNCDMYVIINEHWDGGWWGMYGA